MIPATFDYVRANSVDEAIRLLGDHGDDAKLIAGGHSLLPLMKFRLATPSVLIDIGHLDTLSYVRDDGAELAVGGLTRHHDLGTSALATEVLPVLSTVASQIGDPQVRHRGTIGGSLAHGDPAADLPAVVLALGATIVVEGPRGRRSIAANDFFVSFFEVAMEPDELLVEIRFEKVDDTRFGFEKMTKRAQDWAIVGAVAARGADGLGIGLINMGSVPLRARATETAVAAGASAKEAAALAAEGTEPAPDFNGTTQYRQHLARVLVRRALVDAGY